MGFTCGRKRRRGVWRSPVTTHARMDGSLGTPSATVLADRILRNRANVLQSQVIQLDADKSTIGARLAVSAALLDERFVRQRESTVARPITRRRSRRRSSSIRHLLPRKLVILRGGMQRR